MFLVRLKPDRGMIKDVLLPVPVFAKHVDRDLLHVQPASHRRLSELFFQDGHAAFSVN